MVVAFNQSHTYRNQQRNDREDIILSAFFRGGRRQLQDRFVINSLYIILKPVDSGVAMTQNRSLIQPDQCPPQEVSDFKKQRALYLAERKARKLEAQRMRKKEVGHSSSSDEELPKEPRQPVLIKENYVMQADGKTDSSGGSPPPQESLFRTEREKYKQERVARRQEAVRNRKLEFGSSSSSEDELPLHPRAKLPQIKLQPSPRSPIRHEEAQFGFMSMDLGAKEGKQWSLKEGKEGLQATVRLKDKREVREKYQVEVPSGKYNIWVQRWLEIRENAISLGQRSLPLYDINKIKMIAEPTQAGSLKIKMTLGKQEIYMAAHPKRTQEGYLLDQYYFIFARIVTLKLQLMGRKPTDLPKIKPPLSEKVFKDARIMGKVRKNSFFGGWEEQIAVVGSNGLAVYKQGRQKPTLVVAVGTVRQIWTRFQFQRDNLVLKFFNGLSKVELSVPVQNFLSRQNWLYQLYSLTPK